MPENPSSQPGGWERAWQGGRTPWDHGAAAPPLLEYLQTHPPLTGRILVPGCGAGHEVRALAQAAGDQAEVTGLDLAPTAIARARAFPAVSSESYHLGDLLALPASFQGAFDWIFEHTCLCALEPASRPAYAEAVSTALKPGGRLLAIFFIDVGERDSDGPPFPISNAHIDALLGEHFETRAHWRPKAVFDSRKDGIEDMRILQKSGRT